MAAISKRQQARHERLLQELVETVPGNGRCADCETRNPGWASWNLGIFLCLRCAALHRKMGTHISKVKSLSMDSWSAEQVENMSSNGNTVVNQIYNPRNVRPPIPIDMEEADSVMERYIRQKYEKKALVNGPPSSPMQRRTSVYAPVSRSFAANGATPATARTPPLATDSDTPDYSARDFDREPSLPTRSKTTKTKTRHRFGLSGLRSVSSTFNLSTSSASNGRTTRAARVDYGPASPPLPPPPPSPPAAPAPAIAARGPQRDSLTDLSGDTLEEKIEALRDLGFRDSKKNATVLMGLNGNVDKAVEVLIRLGEGPRFSRSVSSLRETTRKTERKPSIGATINKPTPALPEAETKEQSPTAPPTPLSLTNPFYAPRARPTPPSKASTAALSQSLQQLSLSTPPQQQQLSTQDSNGFSHGAVPAQSQSLPQTPQSISQPLTQAGTNPFLQASPTGQVAPAVYQLNGNATYTVPTIQPTFTGYQQQYSDNSSVSASVVSLPSQTAFTQPAYAQQANGASLVAHQTGPAATTMPPAAAGNLFYTTALAQPQQVHAQLQVQMPPHQHVSATAPQPYAMFGTNGTHNALSQPAGYVLQSPSQQQHYAPPRLDKESILSLYRFSQAPPTIYENAPQGQAMAQPPQGSQLAQQQASLTAQQQTQPQPSANGDPPSTQFQPPRRSVTMPMLNAGGTAAQFEAAQTTQAPTFGSRNPFAAPKPTSQSLSGAQPQQHQQQQQHPQQVRSQSWMTGQMSAAPLTQSTPGMRGHMSQESLDLTAWRSGRQSPDAFAGLSSRYAR